MRRACRNCTERAPTGARFCPTCGSVLPEPAAGNVERAAGDWSAILTSLIHRWAQAKAGLDRAARARTVAYVGVGAWTGAVAAAFVVCSILFVLDRLFGLRGPPGSASRPGLLVPVCINGGLLPLLGLVCWVVVRYRRERLRAAERHVAAQTQALQAALWTAGDEGRRAAGRPDPA